MLIHLTACRGDFKPFKSTAWHLLRTAGHICLRVQILGLLGADSSGVIFLIKGQWNSPSRRRLPVFPEINAFALAAAHLLFKFVLLVASESSMLHSQRSKRIKDGAVTLDL